MSFVDDIERFTVKVSGASRAVFVGCATDVHRSITTGSPITSAPGQPVQSGDLVNSWQLTFPDADTGLVMTNLIYAPGIEAGISQRWGTPMQVRSTVGGFHSMALTVAGWPRIVDDNVQRMAK